MCIIHDLTLHYLFQDMMEAFEKSKMLSVFFLRRVGCLICVCKKDILYDSKTLIATQRALYQWFDEQIAEGPLNASDQTERLRHFACVVQELKQNGRIDSGTKITFMTLLRELSSFNYSQLRATLPSSMLRSNHENKSSFHTKYNNNNNNNNNRRNLLYVKLVKLKFDLKLCSVKEFSALLAQVDNCAINYIQMTNKCTIVLRDIEHLSIRHFLGEIEATIESRYENNLACAELSLKQLADAVHYRLARQLPSCDMIGGGCSLSNLKILLQSPPQSPPPQSAESSFSRSCRQHTDRHSKNFSATAAAAAFTDHDISCLSSNINDMLTYKANLSSLMFGPTTLSNNFNNRNNNNNDKTNNDADYFNDSFDSITDHSLGNTTPMTSSPVSSSSNSPFKFKLNSKSGDGDGDNKCTDKPTFRNKFNTNQRTNSSRTVPQKPDMMVGYDDIQPSLHRYNKNQYNNNNNNNNNNYNSLYNGSGGAVNKPFNYYKRNVFYQEQ